MAFERKDRVKDTTTTTGTGTVTLTGTAPSGYRSVSAAHTDGATVRYAISGGAEWEVGEGVYTASGTTLSRVTVFASSNAGALVSFSAGTKDVITTLTANEVDGFASSSTPTGVSFDYVGSTAPSGYVLLDGKTIGNASSGGTERANADTSALFTLLWDSMADAQAPVSGGRGASAAADFAANKTITLPDARGRTIVGKDNMGGTTASRLTSAGSGIVGTTLGISGGAETVSLSSAQNGSHTHTQGAASPGGAYVSGKGGSAVVETQAATASSGSGAAHQNTQPTLVLNKIIKL